MVDSITGRPLIGSVLVGSVRFWLVFGLVYSRPRCKGVRFMEGNSPSGVSMTSRNNFQECLNISVVEHSSRARNMKNTEETTSYPLHTYESHPNTTRNHAFILLHSFALSALFYHHINTLFLCKTFLPFFLHLTLFFSHAIFTFTWVTSQAFRIRPIKRKTYPQNLHTVVDSNAYPALDVFICTADPYKEPPINVVNTALSVMAYEYPSDKISVYVSDDGGSKLTLFALMEAAKFSAHWVPFCRENNLMDRSPEVYFASGHWCSETEKMKILYESMKEKVETVVHRGVVGDELITNEFESQAFNKWTTGFTRQDHPTVIQVLLESSRDRDVTGHILPNLVYVSREKNRSAAHHFKAGALNVLLRVSATMTNAPLVLTQDCDMYSNDPKTPLNALCFFLDPTNTLSELGYVQFPQRFHGVNADDIYGSELKRIFRIDALGFDGLGCAAYFGTGCFFRRRVFFGGPLSQCLAEIPELNPDHVVDKPIQSEMVQEIAHSVASCSYENGTNWGSKMGFKYGSLVEDYYTGFRLLCEGWKGVLCDPDRAAFLGNVPINLNDTLGQLRRWDFGLLEVGFSKYSPITFGIKSMGLAMGLCFGHYAFWAISSIPITFYAFVPSLALLNGVYLFPKVSSNWYYLYMFIFLGSYGQDFHYFTSTGMTFKRWYNDERLWMVRGLSSHLFGLSDYICKLLDISTFGFNVTSKAVDEEQSKRYKQGLFEFGVASPLFVPLTTATIINLIAAVVGLAETLREGNLDEKFLQLSISWFVVVNSWPVYEAMVLRFDRGRIPLRVTFISIFLACLLYGIAFVVLGN